MDHKVLEKKKKMYVAYMDIERAYKVNRKALWKF